jgi:hypothetical protein
MVMESLSRVRSGWKVVGSDGGKVGEVQDVRESHLVVEHGLINKQTLYVPVSEVTEVRDDSVVLGIEAGRAGEMGWHVRPGTDQPGGPAPRRSGGDMTTMTGAGYGAGGTVASAGPMSPQRGDQIQDRMGGSSRAGLGRPGPRIEGEGEAPEPGRRISRDPHSGGDHGA